MSSSTSNSSKALLERVAQDLAEFGSIEGVDAPVREDVVRVTVAETETVIGIPALELSGSGLDIVEPSAAPESDEDSEVSFEDSALLKEIAEIPDRMAFKIGEVGDIAGVKTYVLRYWESEFEELKPKKSQQNQRMYSRNDVKTVLMIKKLLYRDRFSIEGARKALRKLRSEVKKETTKKSLAERYEKAIDRVQSLIRDIHEMRELFS